MERFISTGVFIRTISDVKKVITSDFGQVKNTIKIRYHFDDPCKYLLWKINVEYPDAQDTDKIHWDLGDYRVRNIDGIINEKSKIIHVVNRVLIEFNGKTREQWKESSYYQYLQEYNKNINGLDFGEGIYSFSLYPKLNQPSGATNLSNVDNVSFYFELSDEIITLMTTTGVKIKITVWECSYNIFVAFSGFGALRFYGTK